MYALQRKYVLEHVGESIYILFIKAVRNSSTWPNKTATYSSTESKLTHELRVENFSISRIQKENSWDRSTHRDSTKCITSQQLRADMEP